LQVVHLREAPLRRAAFIDGYLRRPPRSAWPGRHEERTSRMKMKKKSSKGMRNPEACPPLSRQISCARACGDADPCRGVDYHDVSYRFCRSAVTLALNRPLERSAAPPGLSVLTPELSRSASAGLRLGLLVCSVFLNGTQCWLRVSYRSGECLSHLVFRWGPRLAFRAGGAGAHIGDKEQFFCCILF
jgi:hypothetical protein